VEANFKNHFIMEAINVSKSQITIDEGIVTLESPELINGLIHHNEECLKDLATTGITANEISISKTGKLQIANKLFAEKIKKSLEPSRSDDDVALGNIMCKCDNINIGNCPKA
jgi:hypothetical protein